MYLRIVGKPFLLPLFIFLVFSCDITLEEDTSIKNTIPETAIFGLVSDEVNNIKSFINHPGVQTILEEFNTTGLSLLNDSTLWIDLTAKEFSLSWHSRSKNKLESLMIVQFNVEPTELSWLTKQTVASVTNYNGYQISSLNHESGTLHYCLNNDQLAFSYSKILVEDYIRAFEDQSATIQELSNNASTSLLFINNERLEEIGLESFGRVGGVSLLNYQLAENFVSFDGSIKFSEQSGSNAELFGASYVPTDFESIEWFSHVFSDQNIADSYLKVGLSVFAEKEELFVLRLKNSEDLLFELTNLAGVLLSSNDSLPYLESYANEEIRFISSGFFEDLFGDEQHGFSEGAFFTVANENLLVSTSAEAIRQSLSSHADELTMGQSVEERVFYSGLIQDTYYTLIKSFDPSSTDKTNVDLDRLVYQTNTFSNGVLVSGRIDLSKDRMSRGVTKDNTSGQLLANAFLDTSAVVKAKVLTNHVDQSKELVVQDARGQLYQISSEGEINWKIPLGAPLVAPAFQIDYYNNRKLQYLLLTDSLVHIIDRNGQEIEGFPKAHGVTQKINGIQLIDYDNTKRYRYLIEAARGELYLFNKEVELLDGWDPKNLDAILPVLPKHERIAGKDFFWAAERSNKLIMLNRRAQNYSGFPFQKNFRFSGDVYLMRKPTFQGSQFVALSEKGKLIQVDLLGQLTREEQLFLTNSNTTYQLIKDVLGNGYLICRKEKGSSTFLNEDQEEVFQLQKELTAEDLLSYYRFRGGAEVVLVRNVDQGEIRLYNTEGEQIGETVRSDFAPSLIYYRNKGVYHLFVNFDNEVNLYAFTSKGK